MPSRVWCFGLSATFGDRADFMAEGDDKEKVIVLMLLQELINIGKGIGYSGAELQTFVRDQQDRQREERQLEWEARRKMRNENRGESKQNERSGKRKQNEKPGKRKQNEKPGKRKQNEKPGKRKQNEKPGKRKQNEKPEKRKLLRRNVSGKQSLI